MRGAVVIGVAAALGLLGACADDRPSTAPPTTDGPYPVATFRVADVED